jgi:hypothetical protein
MLTEHFVVMTFNRTSAIFLALILTVTCQTVTAAMGGGMEDDTVGEAQITNIESVSNGDGTHN